jgi:hypothetical protein
LLFVVSLAPGLFMLFYLLFPAIIPFYFLLPPYYFNQ